MSTTFQQQYCFAQSIALLIANFQHQQSIDYLLSSNVFKIPRPAMIPVAAAPVIVPDKPEASPATKRFVSSVSKLLSVSIIEDLNFTSGA